MPVTQMMTVHTSDPQKLASLLEDWHRDQHGTAPGYQGARLLADRDHEDRFVIEVEFSSEGDAQRNSDRPETKAWAEKLQAATSGQPDYHDFEVAFTTG
jgi:quinol monooxygenase YgiN